MAYEVIHTDNAPAAIGPYSQAIKAGNLLFVSGQVPFVPATGEIVEGDVKAQTAQSLKNLQAILKEAGADFSNVVKTTVFIKDMNEFAQVNEVYAEYITEKPARSCVAVKTLPKNVLCEVEVIAELD